MYEESDLYWRVVIEYDLPWVANNIANIMNAHSVGIFGEIYGVGVGDLFYGADAVKGKPGYAVFDVRVETDALGWWLDPDELVSVMRELGSPPPLVPRLYEGPYDEEMLFRLADGPESLSGSAQHVREGLVVRPIRERCTSITGGRAIAKFVSPGYLNSTDDVE